MALRAYPVGSSSAAATVPGLNDYDVTRFETNLLTEGVVQGVGDAFAVVERAAGANMSVDVGAGVALIEITNTNLSHGKTYKTWFENTATVNKTITTADATNPRKDRVVLRIDVSIDPNGTASDIAVIEVLAGTPAGSPSAPATPSNAISLAIIDVPASDTTISTAQITDDRSFIQVTSSALADLARESTVLKTTRAQFADFTEKTIASGAITVTQPLHTVDTEANAASDDLDTITAAYGVGEMIHLKADNTARTVVVKHNTGNILLADGADFSLDDTEKSITLIRKSTSWHEFSRGRGTILAGDQKGKHIWLMASQAMLPPSTGAAALATNWQGTGAPPYGYIAFDATTAEKCFWQTILPDDYAGGTFTVKLVWHANNTGSVVWQVSMASFADDDPLYAGSYGTPQTVTDAVTATNDLMITAATPAITASNSPSAGDLLTIGVERLAADGSDTYAADAMLIGIIVNY